ncbi:MAG: LPS export ABC transporter permease LptG [Syntrophobacteraceae bacterium]
MKIIPRYILKNFLPVFVLSMVAFLGLYLIVDFFEKIDELLEKNVMPQDALAYFLFKTPFIAMQGLPLMTMLAALISLGILRRNRELVALQSVGVSATRYTGPIVAAACFIAAVHFGFGETVARTLNQKAQLIWQQQVQRKKVSLTWMQENVWYHGQNVIYQVRLHDRKRQTLEKVSLFFLDDQFKLVQRIDARRLRWDEGVWLAEEGLVLRFSGAETQQEWFDQRKLELSETPDDFSSLATLPEDLGWLDLYEYTRKIRHEGYNALPYEVELHLRMASSFTTIILALVGIFIALRQGLHGGIAVSTGIGLVVAFIYLTTLHLGCSLATANILPPFIGVWSANILSSAVAAFLWMTEGVT